TKLAWIIRCSVGEFMVGLSPHVLGGGEFRRIGGEVVRVDSRMINEEVPDLPPSTNRPAIPQQVDRPPEEAPQVSEGARTPREEGLEGEGTDEPPGGRGVASVRSRRLLASDVDRHLRAAEVFDGAEAGGEPWLRLDVAGRPG